MNLLGRLAEAEGWRARCRSRAHGVRFVPALSSHAL